jgi:hypothetical protein
VFYDRLSMSPSPLCSGMSKSSAHFAQSGSTTQGNASFWETDATLHPNARFYHFGVSRGSLWAPSHFFCPEKVRQCPYYHVFYDAKRRWPSPLCYGIAFLGRKDPKVAILQQSGEGEVTCHCIFTCLNELRAAKMRSEALKTFCFIV